VLSVSKFGILRAWGRDAFGQLGNGTTATRPSPIVVVPAW